MNQQTRRHKEIKIERKNWKTQIMLILIKRKMGIINIRQSYFRAKTDTCFIMEKRSVQWDDITALNIYAPNKRASKNMKQKLIDIW